MECGGDKQKLYIEFFPCLPAKFIRPQEDAMRVVEEQRRAEFSEESRSLASELRIRDSILYALKVRRRCWYRDSYLGSPIRRACLYRMADAGCTQSAACCSSTACSRASFQIRAFSHI